MQSDLPLKRSGRKMVTNILQLSLLHSVACISKMYYPDGFMECNPIGEMRLAGGATAEVHHGVIPERHSEEEIATP